MTPRCRRGAAPFLIPAVFDDVAVTREISLPAGILGPVKTSADSMVIGLSGSFRLNRQDYGIQWNKILDQGGVAVSDEVTANIWDEAGFTIIADQTTPNMWLSK